MVAGSTAWPMVRLAFTWLTCGECTEMFPGPRRTCAPPTIGPARPSVAPPRWGATKISVSSSPGMIITDSNQRSAVGRPRKHGGELALADPATWPAPQITTSTATRRYGTALAAAWDRVHPRLTHRSAWLDHDGPLPVIDGTLIRLQVDHLPGDRDPKPVWLWSSATGADAGQVDRCWQAFLRRSGPRAHLPAVQTGPRLDRPQNPGPAGRGPVDLADHRGPHPAPPRPAAR